MSLLDDVKARLDIVDVVSSYVPLTQTGRTFKARCPFHTERTPSFVVNPERGTWHCFGACSEGGDAIRFVMKAENQSFTDALHTLAARVGVWAPTRPAQAQRDPLLRANEEAQRYFTRTLQSPEGAEALVYLKRRGVEPETASAFGLGLSPGGWDDLRIHLAGIGLTEEQLVRGGLAVRGQQGGARDLFRGRLMFPIRDPKGSIVGFGGRSLDGGEPKYLNTPQTPFFDKSQLLWGLDVAAKSARLAIEGAVVVEGYMDALMAHHHGYDNTVASMGTALTPKQVEHLAAIAARVTLVLDPDFAGVKAAGRSVATEYWPAGLDVRVVLLPEGKDPDDLIRESIGLWQAALRDAMPWVEFGFRYLPPQFDLATEGGQGELVDKLGDWIQWKYVDEDTQQDRYLEQLEKLVGWSRNAILQRLRRQASRPQRQVQPPRAGASAPTPGRKADPLEDYTLALLLQYDELRPGAAGLSPEFFRQAENREVFLKLSNCSTMDELIATVDAALQEYVEGLLSHVFPPMDHKDRAGALDDCIQALESRHLRDEGKRFGTSLSEAQAEGRETDDVVEELRQYNERRRALDAARVRRGRT